MTVSGVNLISVASFIAAIGDPHRFFTSRKLVAYLGLDPKVKQSGDQPARSGRITKRGSASARRNRITNVRRQWATKDGLWSSTGAPAGEPPSFVAIAPLTQRAFRRSGAILSSATPVGLAANSSR